MRHQSILQLCTLGLNPHTNKGRATPTTMLNIIACYCFTLWAPTLIDTSNSTQIAPVVTQHVVLQCTSRDTAHYDQGYRRLSCRAYNRVIGVVDVNLAQSSACHLVVDTKQGVSYPQNNARHKYRQHQAISTRAN